MHKKIKPNLHFETLERYCDDPKELIYFMSGYFESFTINYEDMSKATLVFYDQEELSGADPVPIYEIVIKRNGLSKQEFTQYLYRRGCEFLRNGKFSQFSILNREDTITEVKK